MALVNDFDNVVYDSGYYALVTGLPDFRPEDAKEVTVGQLLDKPALYRGQPVRMTLTFFDVAAPDRDADSKIKSFEMRAYAGDIQRTKPVTIFSPSAPPTMRRGAKFEVLGYFYKVISRRHEGAGRADQSAVLDVPLLVAYQFNPLTTGSEPTGWVFNPAFLVIPAVVGLGIAYVWLRSRYSRKGTAWQRGSRYAEGGPYRPARYEVTPEEDERIKANLADFAKASRSGQGSPDQTHDKPPPNHG